MYCVSINTAGSNNGDPLDEDANNLFWGIEEGYIYGKIFEINKCFCKRATSL